MVKVSLFMNLKNEKMDKAELLKNRLQASIDFAVKMNENLDSSSWNYQEGILLSCNEAKLVVELIKKITLTDVGCSLDFDKLRKQFDDILDTFDKQKIQDWLDKKS